MSNDKITFFQVVRMMWIDDIIENEGVIRREDICRAFRLSVPQASLDINRYRALNSKRIAYDTSLKSYRQIAGSKPLFTRGHRLAAFEIVQAVTEHYP